MSGGRYGHRLSLRAHPTSARRWDRAIVLTFQQRLQARTRALCDLAVLLVRPAVVGTEAQPVQLTQLGSENQPLIMAELVGELTYATQVVAEHRERLELAANVDHVEVLRRSRIEGQRRLERRLHRAATRQRAAAIVNSR